MVSCCGFLTSSFGESLEDVLDKGSFGAKSFSDLLRSRTPGDRDLRSEGVAGSDRNLLEDRGTNENGVLETGVVEFDAFFVSGEITEELLGLLGRCRGV